MLEYTILKTSIFWLPLMDSSNVFLCDVIKIELDLYYWYFFKFHTNILSEERRIIVGVIWCYLFVQIFIWNPHVTYEKIERFLWVAFYEKKLTSRFKMNELVKGLSLHVMPVFQVKDDFKEIFHPQKLALISSLHLH